MKASVIVTTYNNADVVGYSIEAIFSQSIAKVLYEVIVIDDCSTDDSLGVLDDLAKKYDFLLLRNEVNRGSAYSRNRAAREARNELIVFVQDDIITEQDFLKSHIQAHTALEDEKGVVVGYTYWDARVERTPFIDFLDAGQQFDYERFENADIDNNGLVKADRFLFYTSNLSMKRVFFEESGGLDESFMAPGIAAYDDTEFAWRLHKMGMVVWYAPAARAGHLHQRTLESMTHRKYAEGYLSHMLKQKHPDFSWSNGEGDFWYNLTRLKFGALVGDARLLFIVIMSIIVNPVTNAILEPIAKKLQYTKNIPILFKAVLGYHFNRGFWSAYFSKRSPLHRA